MRYRGQQRIPGAVQVAQRELYPREKVVGQVIGRIQAYCGPGQPEGFRRVALREFYLREQLPAVGDGPLQAYRPPRRFLRPVRHFQVDITPG